MNYLNNGDLLNDLEKIKSFDAPITIAKAEDFNLDYPYAIDVEDTSYFYANVEDRNEDFIQLKKELKNAEFIFIE